MKIEESVFWFLAMRNYSSMHRNLYKWYTHDIQTVKNSDVTTNISSSFALFAG